jgi:hypothetical protein
VKIGKLAAMLFAWVAVAFAQVPPPIGNTLVFGMDHTGTVLVSYTLTVHEDGSAIYAASYPPERARYSPYAATAAAVPNTEVSSRIMVTPGTTKMLFERVRAANGFGNGCESTLKNIAKTGLKTLTYSSSSSAASCTWNYTENNNVMGIAKACEGIALTLDEGRKLEQKHRYDRLALDPEVQYLFDSVKRGDAIEVEIIAPTLRSIADDSQVLERVRTKAVKLLSQAASER